MKTTRYLYTFSFILLALILLKNYEFSFNQELDNRNKENYYFSDSPGTLIPRNIPLISIEEMSNITGGCGGGTCKDYPHSCNSGCTHHNADKCQGSSGNCVNDNWSLICNCPTYYDFISGC